MPIQLLCIGTPQLGQVEVDRRRQGLKLLVRLNMSQVEGVNGSQRGESRANQQVGTSVLGGVFGTIEYLYTL